MDSFEWNKIIGAILGTVLFVMGVGFLAEAIYAPIEDDRIGYALPQPEGDGHGGGEAVEKVVVPLSVLLASASAADGAKVAKKCASCHNFDKGGANKTGPALYGVIGAAIAYHEGFSYSDALKAEAAKDTVWTYEELDAFLTSPKAFAPGTKMTFAGLRSEKDRADLLAYLQTLSDNPVPFPAVEAPTEAATEEPAPASEDAKPMNDDSSMDAPEKPAMENSGADAHDTTAPAAAH